MREFNTRFGDPETQAVLPRMRPDLVDLFLAARERDGEIVTAGGRALNVTGIGPAPAAARDRAYDAAGRISCDGMQIRADSRPRRRARPQLNQP